MSEFDVGAWLQRLGPLYEAKYGVTSREVSERMQLKTAYEGKYGETIDPATDDPLELAVMDAMWEVYFAGPSCRIDNPEKFWPMAKFMGLPAKARASVAATSPTQLPMRLDDAA